MAFCMQCKEEIPALTIVCPHCGYDFLDRETPSPQRGWEYSGAADMMLLVGAVASALAAAVLGLITVVTFVTTIFNPVSLWNSVWQFLTGLVGFCLSLANLIVFLRVANLSRDKQSVYSRNECR